MTHLNDEAKQRVEWTEVEVDSFTLDSLFPDVVPDCVKMDVEGSELRVLRGSQNLLKKGKTFFLMEVHGFRDPEGQRDASEVIEFMRQFGYSPHSFYGKSLFAANMRKYLPRLYYRQKLSALKHLPRRVIGKLRKMA